MDTEDPSHGAEEQDSPPSTITQNADGSIDISSLLSAMGFGTTNSSTQDLDDRPGTLQIPIGDAEPVTLDISRSGGIPVTLQIPGVGAIPVTLAMPAASPGDGPGTMHPSPLGTAVGPESIPGATTATAAMPDAAYSEGHEVTGGYGTPETLGNPK